MKRVLEDETGFPFLNLSAAQLLAQARQAFLKAGLDDEDTVADLNGVEWFPWRGSRVLMTLELCAKAGGLRTQRNDLSIHYHKLTVPEFVAHRRRVALGSFTANQLAALVTDLERDRFDEYVPETLLRAAFTAEALDLPAARIAASKS